MTIIVSDARGWWRSEGTAAHLGAWVRFFWVKSYPGPAAVVHGEYQESPYRWFEVES